MLKMDSVDEIMQLCRLCLVKDEVNIPIFEEQGDIRQIFLKISACLPVKVSREDNLPKNICDGCSCKLEALYQFWNTSANSEKKLMKWLSQGCGTVDKAAASDKHSMNVDPVVLKQEVVEVPDDRHSTDDDLVPDDLNVSNDADDYLIQQQQLPYQNVEFQFQQDELDQTGTDVVQPSPPSRKRRAAAIRAMANMGSEDEANPDLLEPKIAKTEEESEESCNEDPEPTAFVGLPSATDNEQPGPSGVGKPAADAPTSVKLEPECHDYVASLTQKQRRQKRIWNCAKCCESFDTSRKLRQHRQGHRANENDVQYNYRYDDKRRIYCCLTCDIETVNKDEIEKHAWEHEEKYTCSVCEETFVKPYEYSCHLYNHDQTKGFCCPFCKYTTMRRTAIMIHINTFHLRKFIYNCELCGKGFNDCVLFKEHSNVHEGKRPFRCVVCNKDFAFSSYLTSHQVRYHRVTIDGVLGKNQCYICLKSFTRSTTLEKHIKMHGKKKVHEKRHLCDICGKGFAQIDKWRIHYRVHTGIKPYTCSYCAKSFTKRDYLIMHERVHSGEKPYSCKYCGKCFNQGAPLRLHIRSHTGERPYLCHLCQTGFISRSVLNLHLKNCPGTVQE